MLLIIEGNIDWNLFIKFKVIQLNKTFCQFPVRNFTVLLLKVVTSNFATVLLKI